MVLSLFGALIAAICYGVAAVLEARAARAVAGGAGIDPGALIRIARQWVFLLGLALDGLGFAAEIVALRSLPLFTVQAAVAASLAVTAIAAALLLGVRLSRREWIAVLGVCVGLAVLGLSAGAQSTASAGWGFRWGLVVTTGVLIVAGLVAARLARGSLRCVLLGLAGGLGFGLVAIAARILPGFRPAQLVSDPATYLLAAAGIAAFAFYTTALQSGSVTAATAAMVVGETVIPAGIGVLMLGDSTRPGFAPVAAGGFALALACALALGRFGEPAVIG